jgi:hypothetical protein
VEQACVDAVLQSTGSTVARAIPLFPGGNGTTGTTAAPGQPTSSGPDSTTTGTGPGPGTGKPSSPTGSPHTVLAGWSGTVWLARGGVDIDLKGGRKGDTGADLRKDNFTEIAPGRGASLIQWPGDDTPGLADCRGHLEAGNDVPLFDVPEGGYFCVLTTKGQIAVVQYLGIGTGGAVRVCVTTSGTS